MASYDRQLDGLEDRREQIKKKIEKYNPEDIIIIQATMNNYKYDNASSAQMIYQALESEFQSKFSGEYIEIINIRIKDNVETVYTIREERGFNNFIDNQFLKEIFNGGRILNIVKQQENEQEVEEFKNSNSKFDDMTEFIYHMCRTYYGDITEDSKKYFNLENKRRDNDEKLGGATILTNIQLKAYLLPKLNDLKIKISTQEAPLYLKVENASIINENEVQQKEFDVKLGKVLLGLTTFQLGVFQLLSDKKDAKGRVSEAAYEFQHYYDLSKMIDMFPQHVTFFFFKNKQQFLKKQIYSSFYYHKDDSRFYRKLEVIVNYFNKFFLKIDLDFQHIQYIVSEEYNRENILYIKLISPPIFNLSKNEPNKVELDQTKDDWTRIHNIFLLTQFEENLINEFQRLYLINNTVVRLHLQKNKGQERVVNQLLARFQEYSLLNNKIEITSKISPLKPIDEDLANIPIPFGSKFNLLSILSDNRIPLYQTKNYLKELIELIQQQYVREVNKDYFEKYIEATFQSFLKLSNNCNAQPFAHEIAEKNIQKFKSELEQAKKEINELNLLQNRDLRLAYIRRLSLTPSGLIYDMKMPEMTNKILRLHSSKIDAFVRLQFQDENLSELKNIPFVTDIYYKKCLVGGINVSNQTFELFTWSASQLRASSCWVVDLKVLGLTRRELINSIGKFENSGITHVAKYSARLGQNLSSSIVFAVQNRADTKIIIYDDKKAENGKEYTDGIGMISKNLIDEMKIALQNPHLAAVQVRYEGAKGVLAMKEDLPKNQIILRKSMVKFQPAVEYGKEIEILDFNKFRGGFLNRQVILLLMTLGIEDRAFIELQNEHISMIDASIYKYFNVDYNAEVQGISSVIKVIKEMMNFGYNIENSFFIKGVLGRLKARGYMLLRTKQNILVEKAARLIGIIDEYGILEENEIYCSYTLDDKKIEVVEGVGENHQVVLTRNPCIHPGDIRLVRTVTVQEVIQRKGKNIFEPYVNCVIFPAKGKPITCQTAGGDLDGDIYFVSWDPRLIPKKVEPPMEYDEEKKVQKAPFKQRSKQVNEGFSMESQIQFLLEYLNYEALGKIDNSHLAISDKSLLLAKDPRALKLAELHGVAVDFVKTGEIVEVDQKLLAKEWPDFMEKRNKLVTYESKSVLGRLYRDVCSKINEYHDPQSDWMKGIDCSGLPPIDGQLLYGFGDLLMKMKAQGIEPNIDQESEQDLLNPFVNDFFNQYYEPHLEQAMRCIKTIFQSLYGLEKLYDVKNEFEIYSGNFSGLTKGDGIRKKAKMNIDNMQKRIIQHLVIFKEEVQIKFFNKLDSKEKQLSRIALINFFLSYSKQSHKYPINSILGRFVSILYNKINAVEPLKKRMQNLGKSYPKWYRGACWFLYGKELLEIKQREQLMQPNELPQVQYYDDLI